MALGVAGEVKKERWLFMVGQTRVHCDTVEGLGRYMELEVQLEEHQSEAEGEAIAADLRVKLGVAEDDLCVGAYMDMLRAQQASG